MVGHIPGNGSWVGNCWWEILGGFLKVPSLSFDSISKLLCCKSPTWPLDIQLTQRNMSVGYILVCEYDTSYTLTARWRHSLGVRLFMNGLPVIGLEGLSRGYRSKGRESLPVWSKGCSVGENGVAETMIISTL